MFAEPLLPGLVPTSGVLLDERRRPDFRDVFLALARRATAISTAVTRVRLSTLELRDEDLPGVASFCVLVSEVNALHVDAEARVLLRHPRRAATVRMLAARLESGRLEVRSAPLGGWAPDFTVFAGDEGPFAVLTGFHWFERPYPHRGPALASLHGGDAARLAARRHLELWQAAHDVGPALWTLLSRADTGAGKVAVSGG
jgi:hypothetical protein